MLVNTISVIKQRKLDTVFFEFLKGLAQQTFPQNKKEWIISSYLLRLSMIWRIILQDQHDSYNYIKKAQSNNCFIGHSK